MNKDMSMHGVKSYHIGKNNPKTGVITVATCPTEKSGELAIGMASCSPKDRFLKKFGREVAISRMCLKPIIVDWDGVHSAEAVVNVLNNAKNISTRWKSYVFSNQKNNIVATKVHKQIPLAVKTNEPIKVSNVVMFNTSKLKKFYIGNHVEENAHIRPSNQSVMTLVTNVNDDGNYVDIAYSCTRRKDFNRAKQTNIALERLEKNPIRIPFSGHSSSDFAKWFNNLSKAEKNMLVPKAWHDRQIVNIPQTGLSFVVKNGNG